MKLLLKKGCIIYNNNMPRNYFKTNNIEHNVWGRNIEYNINQMELKKKKGFD